eukprot:6094628-Amphidinium_carterae.1
MFLRHIRDNPVSSERAMEEQRAELAAGLAWALGSRSRGYRYARGGRDSNRRGARSTACSVHAVGTAPCDL